MRKPIILRFMVFVVALLMVSFPGWATPIPLPFTVAPSNDGDGTIQAWLIGLINDYNSANGTNLPTNVVGATPDLKVVSGDTPPSPYPSFGANTLSITLPGDTYDYLVLRWGGPGGGVYQPFQLITFPEVSDTFLAPGQNGLSSYAFYGPTPSVPEPYAMLLLGAGLVGLIGFRRKFRK
jgi:hypothetical protein